MSLRSFLLIAIFQAFAAKQTETLAQTIPFCGTNAGTQRQSMEAMKNIKPSSFRSAINIPVQIHMVLNDNGGGDMGILKLRESMCSLNQDYEATGFQFYMENGIHYIRSSKYNEHSYDDGLEMMRLYNVKNVINVYIVGSPAGNCGYFTYQGDAVALSKSCLGKNSHTWAHEFGHYFSLPHTFFGWEGINYSSAKPTSEFQNQVFTQIENIERNNCQSQADNFCDTPPDYISYRWPCDDKDSSNLVQKDVNGQNFRSDGSLFMSYAIDNCMSRFSEEQMFAMNGNYSNLRTDLYRQVQVRTMEPFNNDSASPKDSSVVSSKVQFSWDKVENAEEYLFQLSRNQTFTVLIRNTTLANPFIEVDSLVEGRRYYWRVIPLSKMDFCSNSSSSFTLEVNSSTASANSSNPDRDMIYPNPGRCETGFILKSGNSIDGSAFRIYSSEGTDVTSRISMEDAPSGVLIQTRSLHPGIYFVKYKKQFTKLILTQQ